MMWTREKIVEVFADAYHKAALVVTNMRGTTEILENIRSAILSDKDSFQTWDLIDNEIGQADPDTFQPILVFLRDEFVRYFINSEISYLRTTFEQNQQAGCDEWLRIYAKALSFWRSTFCTALAKEKFPFSKEFTQDVKQIQRLTKYVLHARWGDTYELFQYLAGNEKIPNEERAKFLVTIGDIQLYYYMNPNAAMKQFEQANILTPDEAFVVQGKGEYWLQENEINKALEFFHRAIEIDSNFYNAYASIGDCYEKMEDLDAAESWFQETLYKFRGKTAGYTRLARLYGRQEFFESYKERIFPLLKIVSALAPEDEYSTYIEMGSIYQKLRDYENSHIWYNKAIELDKDQILGYTSKGYSYLDEEKYEDSIRMFRKAVKVAPEAFDGYNGMALAHERNEDWNNARRMYEEALKRRPEWERFLIGNIGRMKWNLGKKNEAVEVVVAALKKDPENITFTNTLSRFAYNYQVDDKNFEASKELYSQIRIIKGKSYETDYQNKVGNLYYYFDRYEEAVNAYNKAIKADQKNAVYYANLSSAWEKQVTPVNRIKILNEAISAMGNAVELLPTEEEYIKKLTGLRMRIHFGETNLKRMNVVTPIAMEIAADLIQYTEDSPSGGLSPRLTSLTGEMRERIENNYGVKIPGIRFRGNETDLPDGTYIILLNEVPIISGQLSTSKRLYPGKSEELIHRGFDFEETNNPLTSEEANWIREENWKNVESAGLELWGIMEYPIRHLEGIIGNNLSEFLGHQEVMNLFDEPYTDASLKIRFSDDLFIVFVKVLKALVSEKVPITSFEAICEKFIDIYSLNTNPTYITEEIRSMPEIKENLPGNNDTFSYYEISPEFETLINSSIQLSDKKTILNLDPMDCQYALTLIRDRVESQRNICLIVENSELRPFISKLVAIEFPPIPVLARKELMPLYNKNIIGEI